jgi:hypothetical protein
MHTTNFQSMDEVSNATFYHDPRWLDHKTATYRPRGPESRGYRPVPFLAADGRMWHQGMVPFNKLGSYEQSQPTPQQGRSQDYIHTEVVGAGISSAVPTKLPIPTDPAGQMVLSPSRFSLSSVFGDQSRPTHGDPSIPDKVVPCCPAEPYTLGCGRPYANATALGALFLLIPLLSVATLVAAPSVGRLLQPGALTWYGTVIVSFGISLVWAVFRLRRIEWTSNSMPKLFDPTECGGGGGGDGGGGDGGGGGALQDILSIMATLVAESILAVLIACTIDPRYVLETIGVWFLVLVLLSLWSRYPPVSIQGWGTLIYLVMVLGFVYFCMRTVVPLASALMSAWLFLSPVTMILFTLYDSSVIEDHNEKVPVYWLAFRISMHVFGWLASLFLPMIDICLDRNMAFPVDAITWGIRHDQYHPIHDHYPRRTSRVEMSSAHRRHDNNRA